MTHPSAHSLDEAWASLEPSPIQRHRAAPPAPSALPPSVAARTALLETETPVASAPSPGAAPSMAPAQADGNVIALMEQVLKELRLAREESERKHQTLLLAACLLLAGMVILMDRSLRRSPAASPPNA